MGVKEAGYTDNDILKTMRDVSIIRKHRYKSINNEKYDRINERMENIARKFKKIGKAKEEKKEKGKLSRSKSLNSLGLKLPRRNSLQNFQTTFNVTDPLALSYHKSAEVNTVESMSTSLENDIHETINEKRNEKLRKYVL